MKKYFAENMMGFVGTTFTEEPMFIRSLTKEVKDNANSLLITFADRSGTVRGRVWSESFKEAYTKLNEQFVLVSGEIGLFKGEIALNVRQMEPLVDKKGLKLSDFSVVSPLIREMLEDVEALIEQVESPLLRGMLDVYYKNQEFVKAIARCQGGSVIHHNYVGGFLEHTLAVTETALGYVNRVMKRSPFLVPVNQDLIIAGGLFHDIGKIKEYEFFPVNKRTTAGKLMGHVNIGVDMVSDAYAVATRNGCETDEEICMLLKHIILSSHGDEGSIKPATIEAICISRADHLDSHVSAMESSLEAERNIPDKTDFTRANRFYGGVQFYRGATDEQKREVV